MSINEIDDNSSTQPEVMVTEVPNNPISETMSNNEILVDKCSMPLKDMVLPILKLVPPQKTIFLSRFDSSTSEDDIVSYIKAVLNLENNNGISCNKFKFKTAREIASFTVKLPSSLFNLIVDPLKWPENTVVREFVTRPRETVNRDHLQNIAQMSKN